MSGVWVVRFGKYDSETVGVTSTKDGALQMVVDHSRANPVCTLCQPEWYELTRWELGEMESAEWDQVYAKNGDIIKETYTRTDVSAYVESVR